MQHLLIDHNQDLLRLRNEGYEIEIKEGGHIYVHHVPYVTKDRKIQFGTLVSAFELSGKQVKIPPANGHVVMFSGDFPCYQDGTKILPLLLNEQVVNLNNGIIIKCSFSNKPSTGYKDFYEKFTRYIDVISGPAHSIDPSATAKTFRVLTDEGENNIFQYIDTNSSRAFINGLNKKLEGQKIGIVGLGGTGAYILDQVAKTPVSEIHIFDDDLFLQHNAFRSPGAASIEVLNEQPSKVDYYAQIYGNMRKGIFPYCAKIDEHSIAMLDQFSFIFVCIDNDYYRKYIAEYLVKKSIPFIDVGLGVNRIDESLIAMLRVTVGHPDKNDHLAKRLPVAEGLDNLYGENIQIADLNALNAILAVIKWKKLCGFYQDLEGEYNSTYTLNVGLLNNEDHASRV